MHRAINKCLTFLILLGLTSCFQTRTDEDEICAIPTTNNPRILPNYKPEGTFLDTLRLQTPSPDPSRAAKIYTAHD